MREHEKHNPVILIVEDEEGLNSLIKKVLKREGFVTEGVLNGEDAIRRISDDPDVILLLDFVLPDMTGKEVIDSLAKNGIKVPFIIMTGHGDENLAVDMMKLGAKDYIVKGSELAGILPHVLHRVVYEIEQEYKLIEAQKANLEKQAELSVLFNVSSALSQTLEIKKLFDIIFQTIAGLDMFHIQEKGGVFMVDGDRMTLISHVGHSDSFIESHKGMRVGDCLCGLAAKTGEIIISKNSHSDSRHTIQYPEIAAHGHIIIPLKARDIIVGVLYLYMDADFDLPESKLRLLDSIGNQIGVSIDNARLYEETKKSSLHDPLTGLANRRLMHIVFSRVIAEAKRTEKPFSVIMLDIDRFKEYNDTKGHSAGDKLLAELAGLIMKESREIDLVARFGGEEFLLILPDTSLEMAYEAAERIRKAVESKTDVTISLGATAYTKETVSEEHLTNKADSALYLAKRNGRNRVEMSR
ncbi:MAG: diguanylate cyclase [Thermodesulfovibrionia bacterium]|nr:diguanylate cyclase [Thermodesulfovibrionia bacterium]